MKRKIIFLLVVSIVFGLFGCAAKPDAPSQSSSEKPQTSIVQSASQNNAQESTSVVPSMQKTPEVPESVVLLTAEINIDSADRYTLVHTYDEAAHIDNVEFSLYYEGPYGGSINPILGESGKKWSQRIFNILK